MDVHIALQKRRQAYTIRNFRDWSVCLGSGSVEVWRTHTINFKVGEEATSWLVGPTAMQAIQMMPKLQLYWSMLLTQCAAAKYLEALCSKLYQVYRTTVASALQPYHRCCYFCMHTVAKLYLFLFCSHQRKHCLLIATDMTITPPAAQIWSSHDTCTQNKIAKNAKASKSRFPYWLCW